MLVQVLIQWKSFWRVVRARLVAGRQRRARVARVVERRDG